VVPGLLQQFSEDQMSVVTRIRIVGAVATSMALAGSFFAMFLLGLSLVK
jgi:hypothetical protein